MPGHPPDEANGSHAEICGPPLAYFEVIAIAKRAITAIGGSASDLEREYRITITANGCDYDVLGVRLPETIPQEFFMTIDRSGKIKSWPWCCVF
jgi:hypothetical protein